jgi:HEAT repeat protein
MHTRRRSLVAALLVAASFSLASDALPGDPGKDIKDKDFKVRIAAIEALELSGGKETEALLLDALKDKDWQVVERAAAALGRKGGPGSLDELVLLAAQGPIRRIRMTAAKSAGMIDETKAIEALGHRLNGEYVVHALESVGAIVTTHQNEAAAKVLDEALKTSNAKRHEKEMEKISGGRDRDPVRRAAASSLTAFPTDARATRVEKLMFDTDLGVAAAALDTVIEAPDPAFLPLLVSGLSTPKLDDCIERRIRFAMKAIVATKPAGGEAAVVAGPIFTGIRAAPTPETVARFARVLGELGKAPPPPPNPDDLSEKEKEEAKKKPAPQSLVPADQALDALSVALNHVDPKPRAAACVALTKIRSNAAVEKLLSLAANDADAHVRAMAVRGVAATITAKDARAFKVFQEKLADPDLMVREESAVALGVRGVAGAVPSLMKVVEEAMAEKPSKDKKNPAMKWAVATDALVSMGKTTDPDAVEPLRKVLKEAKDWRLRASALVGLGRVQKASAVPDIIDSVDDKDPTIHNTAYEFLRRMTSKDVEPTSAAWREWWKQNSQGYVFIDLEAEYRKAHKFGYAPSIEGLYRGLDIVVLATRGGGDRIEDLLDELKIVHRLCRQPQVQEAGLHPFALFVANCPGEVGEKDVEALSWFVRVGGYLFGSCWALHETIEKIYPGVVRRYDTPGAQVIDYNVTADACEPDSIYFDGVFDNWTRPMYVLEGAHLIEQLDRDRNEVLIDSPCSASSWGSGNLACWFTAGHGVILDSVNHFNHQGFHFALNMKTAEDRMAFAMDHMGITYAEAREFMAKKVFDKNATCEKQVTDQSAFKFLSNFVRAKRKVDL